MSNLIRTQIINVANRHATNSSVVEHSSVNSKWRKKILVIVGTFLIALVNTQVGHCEDTTFNNNSRWNIIVVERDTLQTRNLTPIINHATLVANTLSQKVKLILRSAVPPELDQSGPFWPRFGRDSLIGIPLLPGNLASPQIDQYDFLESPEKIKNGNIVYQWKFELEPKHAAIAQYDNYYGLPERFALNSDTLQILGLKLSIHYKTRQVGNNFTFNITVEMVNIGSNAIQELYVKLCIPEEIINLNTHKTIRLFRMLNHKLTEAATYSQVGHADGFGNRVTIGHAANVSRSEIKPGEEISFMFEFEGSRTIERSEIYPAYLISFKDMEVKYIWPETQIFLEGQPAEVKKYYYRESNLFLPAPSYVLLTHDGIIVGNPRNLTPTFSPRHEKHIPEQ